MTLASPDSMRKPTAVPFGPNGGREPAWVAGVAVAVAADKAIEEGQKLYEEAQPTVRDQAQKLAEAHRKLDEDAAQAS